MERSREVIQDARTEKINLTTGPMAITGSTRMQATSIQLAVMLTVLEMEARELVGGLEPSDDGREGSPLPAVSAISRPICQPPPDGAHGVTRPTLNAADVPREFGRSLETLLCSLRAPEFLPQLARLVELEESVYRAGGRNNYFADQFAMDVLTDTTERSPTFCTPPFRKFDDTAASESWAFLFTPGTDSPRAWERLLKRAPRCVEWSDDEVRALVPSENLSRTLETIRKISRAELMRFRIGQDGLSSRKLGAGDCAVAVFGEREGDFAMRQLAGGRDTGAQTGVIYFGEPEWLRLAGKMPALPDAVVSVPLPRDPFLLQGVTRVAVKLVLNALSTCTMVRLGRVMGNFMVWVVPSNLKLIDRATRYIAKLTGLGYESSNALLFEVVEYVEPRMSAGLEYPAVVGMAVLRHRRGLTNEAAEAQMIREAAEAADS